MTPKTSPRHDFEGFWEPKWKYVGTKIASKLISCQKRRKPFWYWKSHYFFNKITFSGVNKRMPNRSKITPKLKSRWEGLLTRILSLFYMFFRARDPPDTPRMASQSRQDGSQDVAKTPPDLQEAPKIPPRPSKMRPKRAKTSPRRSKKPSRVAKTAIMTRK